MSKKGEPLADKLLSELGEAIGHPEWSPEEVWDALPVSGNERRRRNTEEFLVELKLHDELVKRPGVEDGDWSTGRDDEDRKVCASLASPFDREIKAGQVRIPSGLSELRHLMVVREWVDGVWLVVPISRLSSPATSQEVKVDKGQVLQVWLTHTLKASTLEKSWVAYDAPQRMRDIASEAVSSYLGGKPLSPATMAMTGLPSREEEKAILPYMEREYALWAEMFRAEQDEDADTKADASESA